MHSFSPDSLCLQALLWPKGEKVPRRAHVRLPTTLSPFWLDLGHTKVLRISVPTPPPSQEF